MTIKFTNNAVSRLSAGISAAATTINLITGEGSRFPSLTTGDWFPLTLFKSTGELEILRCTARATDSLTVTRAQENTTGIAFLAGDRVELRLTAAAIDALRPDWDSLSGKPTFATVSTTGSYANLVDVPTFDNVAYSGAYADLSGVPTLGSLAAKSAVAFSDITPIATADNYRANLTSVLLTPNGVWSAAVPVVLTYAAALTLDFATFLNAKLTLTGNVVLNTANVKPGQSGTIEFLQDATGSRTWGFTTAKFAYTGSAPVLPTTANARVLVPYYAMSDSRIFLNMSAAMVLP